MNRGGILCLLSFFLTAFATTAQEITCTANKEEESEAYGQIIISGLGDELIQFQELSLSYKEWTSFFEVKVKGGARPVLGSYEVTADGLIFSPRFLPDPQISYSVRFSSKLVKRFLENFSKDVEINQVVRFGGSMEKTAEVVKVFPGSDILPSNILRLYVEFSEPMSFDNPHHFIQISDEDGKNVIEPFVEIQEGLWNGNRTRLTLLFHPGRIKRGVGPNMTMGEIFTPGKKYTLSIDEKWSAGTGNGLKRSFAKSFQVNEPIREIIKIEDWEIDLPKGATKQQLRVRTGRLLDKALAERMISVLTKRGDLVDGEVAFDGETRTLSFVPVAGWTAGDYKLSVNPKLEDVCGNTPLNVFDLEGSGQKASNEHLSLEFTVK